jgi:hypothetical protein
VEKRSPERSIAAGKSTEFRLLHDCVLANNIFGISAAATAHDGDITFLRKIDVSLMQLENI